MSDTPPPQLNARQAAFARHFAASGNATQSAIKAGYSKNGVAATASQLLTNPKIAAAVQAEKELLVQRTSITKDWVVARTVKLLDQAEAGGEFAAANSSLKLLSLLHGHIIERRDVRKVASWADLSDEEVAALANAPDTAPDAVRH